MVWASAPPAPSGFIPSKIAWSSATARPWPRIIW
jgi:hypothetical protein